MNPRVEATAERRESNPKGSHERLGMPPDALEVVVRELNRRVKRGVAKARRKQREYKFQDERIHRARVAALAEFLEFVRELRRHTSALNNDGSDK